MNPQSAINSTGNDSSVSQNQLPTSNISQFQSMRKPISVTMDFYQPGNYFVQAGTDQQHAGVIPHSVSNPPAHSCYKYQGMQAVGLPRHQQPYRPKHGHTSRATTEQHNHINGRGRIGCVIGSSSANPSTSSVRVSANYVGGTSPYFEVSNSLSVSTQTSESDRTMSNP